MVRGEPIEERPEKVGDGEGDRRPSALSCIPRGVSHHGGGDLRRWRVDCSGRAVRTEGLSGRSKLIEPREASGAVTPEKYSTIAKKVMALTRENNKWRGGCINILA